MEAASATPTICIPAKSQSQERVRCFCRAILENHTVDTPLRRKLVLAIDEAVANVIEHAYEKSGEKSPSTIELSFELRPDRIVVRILDRGDPFDPRRQPEPSERRPAESVKDEGLDLRVGVRRTGSSFPRRGFGLRLIRLIMDEIEYQRTPHGENLLTLTKRIRKGGGEWTD